MFCSVKLAVQIWKTNFRIFQVRFFSNTNKQWFVPESSLHFRKRPIQKLIEIAKQKNTLKLITKTPKPAFDKLNLSAKMHRWEKGTFSSVLNASKQTFVSMWKRQRCDISVDGASEMGQKRNYWKLQEKHRHPSVE